MAFEIQLSFDFSGRAEPDRPEPVAFANKCRNSLCSKPSAKGKAYCSKAHSPYGNLEDEPDNSPIEWFAPEGSQWMQDKAFY